KQSGENDKKPLILNVFTVLGKDLPISGKNSLNKLLLSLLPPVAITLVVADDDDDDDIIDFFIQMLFCERPFVRIFFRWFIVIFSKFLFDLRNSTKSNICCC